jgi:hypothetical protein
VNHDSGSVTPEEKVNIIPIIRVEPRNVIIPMDNIIFTVDRMDGITVLYGLSIGSNQLVFNPTTKVILK